MHGLVRCGVLMNLIFGGVGNAHNGDDGPSDGNTTTDSSIAASIGTQSISSALLVTPTYGNGTCPSRTANYITHTLPQQCLRTDRSPSNANLTAKSGSQDLNSPAESYQVSGNGIRSIENVPRSDGESGPTAQHSTNSGASATPDQSVSTGTISLPESARETDSPLDNANFLSFEEWKKQNLVKPGRDGNRNLPTDGNRQRPGINNALDSLGDEGEIDIGFTGFGGPASGPSQHQAAYRAPEGTRSGENVPKSQAVRSKDAGKTCKERTNYASFDCAATILKNNPECKSASSVLVENKDSYMLNTCSASNKFFIVELCNDILVDTVVLANYEFFSSIFRHFRVSVSDRYPVKMDKWRDLGTFEARNSREVQAFLIEHPQIWARYLRIEFLTHYGSEYYCPISLLRVHGTTMLEDVQPQEEGAQGESEDEPTLEAEAYATPPLPQMSGTSTVEAGIKTVQAISNADSSATTATAANSSNIDATTEGTQEKRALSPMSPALKYFGPNGTIVIPGLPGANVAEMTCSTNFTKSSTQVSTEVKAPTLNSSNVAAMSDRSRTVASESVKIEQSTSASSGIGSDVSKDSTQATPSISSNEAPSSDEKASDTTTTTATIQEASHTVRATNSTSLAPVSASSQTDASTNTTTRSTATTSVAAQPQPSTQESFFKSIHKRLQQLESNSTLSLQYIEEQSRILRDAFSKVEKRQISTTSNFLTNLNETVMTELKGFRQAYDQLWQSTVIELEGQREQYQREMLMLSERLRIAGEELLWQKRIGIVQATLLLLCLGLVLFARTGTQGYLEVPLMQSMVNKSSAALSRAGWESPPEAGSPSPSRSPARRSPVSLLRRKLGRSATEPESVGRVGGGSGTDGTDSAPDSRPESKDGLAVTLEPPTSTPPEDPYLGGSQWDDALSF